MLPNRRICPICLTSFERPRKRSDAQWARRKFCSVKCRHESLKRPLSVRLWAKVDKSGDCWIWTGCRIRHGYGRISGPGRKPLLAHRVAYELTYGPIPDGLELDHLCRNPSCVRPDHLEPVTHLENVRRGDKGKNIKAKAVA